MISGWFSTYNINIAENYTLLMSNDFLLLFGLCDPYGMVECWNNGIVGYKKTER
jgi:hypothetical protein